MSANYALVDTNGVVQHVIVYDGVSPYTPPEGFSLIAIGSSGAWVGSTYANGVFSAPPAAPTPPTATPTIAQQIMALEFQQTDRMVRETLTNVTDVFPAGSPYAGLTSAQALASIQSQIVALRAQLPTG